MLKHYLIICLLMLICLTARSANISENSPTVSLVQTQEVSGRVTDENGQGFPGVNILLKGTTIGTVTDSDGKYSLQVTGQSATLVFSFVGYAQSEVAVEGRSVIDVEMK